MSRRQPFLLVKSAIGPAIALFVIAYFAGAAIVGPNGLMSLAGYRHQRAERTLALQSLQAERDQLAHHAALLDPRHVDPDYAEEILRRQTGQVRPDEVILPAN